MISTSNIISLKQYKTRKKFVHLTEIIFSKDALFFMFIAIFIVALCIAMGIANYYGVTHYPDYYYPSFYSSFDEIDTTSLHAIPLK